MSMAVFTYSPAIQTSYNFHVSHVLLQPFHTNGTIVLVLGLDLARWPESADPHTSSRAPGLPRAHALQCGVRCARARGVSSIRCKGWARGNFTATLRTTDVQGSSPTQPDFLSAAGTLSEEST